MKYLIEQFGLFEGYSIGAIITFLRYVFFAGIPFFIFYYFKKDKWNPYKIQKKSPKRKDIIREMLYSFQTAMIFAAMGVFVYKLNTWGYTHFYDDVSTMGIGYFIFSIIALLFINDTYFYWMHRMAHHPKIFPYVHKIHHLSRNPTPWTALSFDASEAILEILFIPFVVVLMPLHFGAFLVFVSFSLAFNVYGHLGYEILPTSFVKNKWFKWMNTSTHHNMHHKRANGNFGLYFNLWDTWMGTNHKNYEKTFEEVTLKNSAIS